MADSATDAILQPFLMELAIAPPADWQARVRQLHDLLVEANRTTNLTRIIDERDYLLKHIADSWLVLRVAPELLSEPLRVADVGCGAGFPGLPLALLCPRLELAEIEANGKKIAFVEEAISALGLAERVTAVRGRARELSRLPAHHGRYDRVLARAVADTGTLVKECRHLLAPGGILIACKTPEAIDEEREIAQREADKAGLSLRESARYTLPEEAGERQFLLLEATDG